MAAKFEPGGIRLGLWQQAVHQCLIAPMQGPQQHGAAPAIQHAVMGAEDHLVVIGGQFETGKAQQGGLLQRDRAGQILLAVCLDPCLCISHLGQVLIVEWQLGVLEDALQRHPVRQHQFAAKGRPAGDLPLPGLTVDRHVQRLVIVNLGLQVIGVIPGQQRPVMEHALLKRGHGQQGLHLAPAQHPIEPSLREVKPREVARGMARRLQVAAVLHQRRQVVRQPRHQGVARLLVEGAHLAQGEAAIKHAPVQTDQLARQVVRGRGCPRRQRQGLPGLSGLALMADPQVVEDDQGFGQCPATWVVQSQGVEAHPLVRHGAQLLLGGADQRVPLLGIRQRQRVGAGEPAEGTAHVQFSIDGLAAVPFQHHAVTAAVTLLAQGTGQGRQQQVGHPGEVGLVGGVDEPSRGLLTQLQQAGGGAAIGGARSDQQVTLAAFPLSQPEAKLILFPFGVGREPLTPLAIAAALGGQRLAPAHPGQILGQNAPGDRIDDQVMEGEEEPLHRLALPLTFQREIAQAGPGQGVAAGRVEISLQLGQAGLQLGLIEIGGIQGRQRRQWQFGQVALAGRGHRQTQGIVVLAQGIQPAAQGLIVHPGRQAQDHPLVPVTGLGKALLEEPVLNGVERELAGQAALLAPVADRLLLAELAAEAAHRLGFEHVLHAAVQPRIPQPGGELDAEDGVTA